MNPVAPPTEAQRYAGITRRAKKTSQLHRTIVWFLLLLGTVAFMLPLYVMVAMSLKTPDELNRTSSFSWPQNPTLDNFREIFASENVNFLIFAQNSFIIAVLSTAGVVLSASLVAFAFARLRFRGRDRLFIIVLSTMMLPGVVTLIPSYVIFAQIGWVDTFLPLIVPAWFGGGAFNVFLLRQFFLGLPYELDEAALIDGASYFRIFWQITLPLSKPALATVGVFSFIYSWRDFLGPLIYLDSPDKQTLELGLQTFRGFQSEQWHLLMAGSTIVMIPLIVIFFIGQRYFIKGIALTGGK